MKNNQDFFNVLRKVSNKPGASQRKLAQELGFSLGKLNYCLKALQTKGLVKIKNLSKKKRKLKYVKQYILTPKKVSQKELNSQLIL